MEHGPDRYERATAIAAQELENLQQQAERARESLTRLKRDVVEAESQLGSRQAAQLLEANEQLVLAMLQAQSDAETTARALSQASRSAELDALTELPNRVLLHDRLAHAIAIARRRKTRLALLFLDLDNFKTINDTLGHATGDEVLLQAAHCLNGAVREADTVSRYGGDEFVILLTEVSQASDAARVAQKVLAALGAEHTIGAHALHLSASIGISIFPDDGDDADALIGRADAAMYRAKRHGRGDFAFHGKALEGETALTEAAEPDAPPLHPSVQHEQALNAHKQRHAQLRDANEHLLMAALAAQDLQAGAEQAQRRQTEFLAVLAHELRNPLAPIRTAASLLGRVRTDDAMLIQLQGVIERQVVHMSRLVGDLLDVSRISTGKLRLERRMVDMREVIAAAVGTCRSAIETRLQRFEIHMPACELTVHGDAVRLEQVVSNLIDNASKYTPDGGAVELAVEVVGANVVLTVSDSGIGITAAALPNIFEPFVQDAHAIGFHGAGLGIGLTVVRELVGAHGGSVVASSEGTGRGSRFVVTLPLLAPLAGVHAPA
jgi:diguanylate cyclase (GGDEF)-like protein